MVSKPYCHKKNVNLIISQHCLFQFHSSELPHLAGKYFTGDWAYRDIDGDYQIVGRKDDIVRIKGVWVQVPEIESSIAVSYLLLR